MNKNILLIGFISAFFLTACNEKIYTVEEFVNNKELRKEYREKCRNGELDGNHLNCQNSFKAVNLSNRVGNASWK